MTLEMERYLTGVALPMQVTLSGRQMQRRLKVNALAQTGQLQYKTIRAIHHSIGA